VEARAPAVDPLKLLRERPEESAYDTFSNAQRVAGGVLLVASVGLLLVWPVEYLVVLNAAAILFYTVHSLYKFHLVYLSLGPAVEIEVSPEELASVPDDEWPTYTVLVPLYREAAVLEQLVAGLSRLDYPRDKLEVLLLVEEDDEETLRRARALRLRPPFRVVVVPDSAPKTKPKACNHGLYASQSDLLVVYDAEDQPDPDQLKKAACAFRKVAPDVICLQAKLNYFNQRQNLLTKWFTAEYSMWFDLFLPGLTASRGPIPLGGTSNHFRTDTLKALGGWDPFNVTEDCDLGVRLQKRGYSTAVIDSTTWEEANSDLRGWIRQRSRWAKGYMQTWLVHMRRPLGLWRSLGTRNFLSFHLFIGGTIFCFLVNPIYWALTAVWFLWHWEVISATFAPSWVYALGMLCLILGNFVFVYLSVAGCMKRGYYDLVKWAVLTPIYWVLMSVGGWKGFCQLFSRPHYWEKTRHGLAVRNAHAS
jgi:cellulose synthase/poly-beta-1,6-N-acetylglucosamine synthase-like glycosyltransferase